MPTADSYAASAALRASAPVTVQDISTNTPIPFSAWDTMSAETQAKYNTVIVGTNPNNVHIITPTITATPVSAVVVGTGGSGNGNSSGSSLQNAVKIATSNLLVFDETSVDIESIAQMTLDDIGGQELLESTTTDMIYDLKTQAAGNQIISNLSSVQELYNSKTLISLQGTSEKYFANFAMDISKYIPLVPTSSSGSHVYIQTDSTTNLDSLIIEVVNIDLENNERVEVEILAYDDFYHDTIY